jgi:putative mycofactocin binding protein MftB
MTAQTTPDATFDAQACWRLAPSVALRPEPFGALAYDFTTRKLSFLKSPLLVQVVERLVDAPSALAVLDTVGVTAQEQPRYVTALATLARTGMITRREPKVS